MSDEEIEEWVASTSDKIVTTCTKIWCDEPNVAVSFPTMVANMDAANLIERLRTLLPDCSVNSEEWGIRIEKGKR